MSEVSTPEKKTGCGLFNAVFPTKKFWPRRTTSTGSLPTQNGSLNNNNDNVNGNGNAPMKIPSSGYNSKRRRGSFDDLDTNTLSPHSSSSNHAVPKVTSTVAKQPQQQLPQPQYQNGYGRKPSSNDTSMEQPQYQNGYGRKPSSNDTTMVHHIPSQGYHGQNPRKMVPKESLGISGELDNMINDHLRNRPGSNLVRVSSGNVMVHSSLGNLRQPGGTTYTFSKPTSNGNANATSEDQSHQMPTNNNNDQPSKYSTIGMGNIVSKKPQAKPGGGMTSLCRALSCRMDPEELKILGNEDYKNGRFAEALALYERAVDLDPTKASYRSNKSAALTALGRLLEAVFECREAITLEPTYHRAHHRLANLYLRLGETEKTLYHYKQAGPEADPDAISKAKIVIGHLKKCDEAKRLKDWHTVLKESSNAIAAGADSAPMIFGLQTEAYLKLHRHQDADTTLTNGPNFDVDECTKFLGPSANATLLLIRAQVDLVAGRFDDAMGEAQHAGGLDPSNREAGIVLRRARAVSAARSHGNDLFKESRFSEACVAYGQGLDHDPYNSVLLCNRAACRTKLGQFDKAIEDSTSALTVRPSYTKARLRRADCYVKLRKWEAAIRDYEMLLQESPGDEDVGKALFEAQIQLKKLRGEVVSNMKFGDVGVVKVQSNEQFRDLTSWPGLSVALFSNKSGDKQTLHFMEQLSKSYPTVKFLKIEVEDNQSLVKSECVSSLPAFKIYKSGSSVKEVPGEDHEALESSIKDQTS